MKLTYGVQYPRMVVLLLRDGIFYFVAVFGVLIINTLAFHLAKGALAQVASGFFVAIPCMVGSRIFLNVREQLLEPNDIIEESTTGYELEPYRRHGFNVELETGIEFADPIVTNLDRVSLEPNSATDLIPKNGNISLKKQEPNPC
ncbi:hypothetical protein M422DRAFT_46161 [Sphaerobolus stellatus SS14]|nr:hypothetical protein M422DRAFT_46161 [Sphaerobolus stellatus SS14]